MAILGKAGLYDKRLSAKPVRADSLSLGLCTPRPPRLRTWAEIIVVRLRRHAGPGYVSGPSGPGIRLFRRRLGALRPYGRARAAARQRTRK
jgi:hypothetical protein